MVRVLTFLLSCWIGVAAAAGPERIIDFHSDIQVYTDGSMVVTETIRVEARGNRIKRGIYRDFPTDYSSLFGRVTVPFRVLGVLRDGAREHYRVEDRSNGRRVYIGRANVILKPGEYEYTITYRTDRQLGFFADHDELYWNVTGNGWDFDIERASATVRLPQQVAANALQLNGYTGPEGATNRDYTAVVSPRGNPEFHTTTPLRAREGLTIVIGWPKGIVAEPSRRQRIARWAGDNPEWKNGALGTTLLLIYYLLAWSLVGRDPEGRTIIPRFEPPNGISAADASYLQEMGFNDKSFAAGLISLAVKGHVTIDAGSSGENTVIAQRTASPQPLTNDEQSLHAGLALGQSGSLLLAQKNHQRVQRARKALEKELKTEHFKRHFVTNGAYTLPGLLISAVTIAGMLGAAARPDPAALFMIIWLTGWSFGVYVLLAGTLRLWRDVGRGRKALNVVPALFMTAFSIPFVAGEIFGLTMLVKTGSPLLGAGILLCVTINYAFYRWLKAPTQLGRRIYDELAGFRMYLAVAEKDRLNLRAEPERTPALYERYLPYALALGVENEWSEKFAEVLARAAAEGGSSSYRPTWYRGSSHGTFSPGSFGSGLAGAIAAASTAPGSSSGGGGGGGGSSGGGGGGGGGGGW